MLWFDRLHSDKTPLWVIGGESEGEGDEEIYRLFRSGGEDENRQLYRIKWSVDQQE